MTRRPRRARTRGAVTGGKPAAKPRRRLGGRSARVRSSVFQAALRLLAEKGLDAFTIAEVAARAGVHETSIYRRWGTRDALAWDALMHHAESGIPVPDTGSLRSDLVALLERFVAAMASPQGRALLALASSPHPHVVAARRAFWQRRFDSLRPLFERAVSRHEFPRQADPMEFLEILIAPLYLRALVTAEPLEEWPRNALIDRMLAVYAVRRKHGVPSPRRTPSAGGHA
jgi:AcrR family transcriptional regulator